MADLSTCVVFMSDIIISLLDYECVVSKIFDSLKHDKEKIPAQKVMKMIAPYIGDDR